MAWRCVENEPVLQRQSILGCWVLAFLAWFPASGTCASAPKGRRLLLTGFVFQNIPRYSFSLGSLRTLTTVTMWKTMEERDPAKRSQEDLLWTLEWIEGQACPKVGWIFFPGIELFPFFFELSQDWKSESLLYTDTRSLGKPTIFHSTCSICLPRDDPEKTPKCLHHQRQQNVF